MAKVSAVSPGLYHYTNEQGLYGILDHHCLWSTHYKFLNDYKEIELFRDTLIECLFPRTVDYFNNELIPKNEKARAFISAKGGSDAMAKLQAKIVVDSCYDALYEIVNHEIYISSFTGEHSDPFINKNGLLSQWRAYGADGGFAIVFNTEKLETMIDSERKCFHSEILFDTVVYSEEGKYESELSEPLNKIFEYQKAMTEAMLQGREHKGSDDTTQETYDAFVSCITRWKHQGFKEEQEVRIVSMPTNFSDQDVKKTVKEEYYNSKLEKERKFRDKNGQRTPYIELFRSLDTPLPIEKIIVGPHKDKDTRAAALRVRLRNTIKVEVSEIPYQ